MNMKRTLKSVYRDKEQLTRKARHLQRKMHEKGIDTKARRAAGKVLGKAQSRFGKKH